MLFSFGRAVPSWYKGRSGVLAFARALTAAVWTLLLCACVNPFYPSFSGKGEDGAGGTVNSYEGYEAGLYRESGGTWVRNESIPPNDLVTAVTAVNISAPGDFLLIINEDIDLATGGTQNLTNNTLIVATDRSIRITNHPNMNGGGVFRVQGGAKLTLEHGVTLRSHTDKNNSSMVDVQDGEFIMKAGSRITGHTRTDNNVPGINGGAGVIVQANGIFTMEGGEISGNYVERENSANTDGGGGVQVNGGVFTMTGGLISNNTAEGYGGGVLVTNSGRFTMTGGTIALNETEEDGGGVAVYDGSVGEFTMQGGVIYGNRTTGGGFGGGVYAAMNAAFTKSGNSVIYGSNETGRDNDGNWLRNRAGGGTNPGHAVYADTSITRYRNTTAGPGEGLDLTNPMSTPPWNM